MDLRKIETEAKGFSSSLVSLESENSGLISGEQFGGLQAEVFRQDFIPSFAENGEPVIQHEWVNDFRLVSGSIISKVRCGFCVFGEDPSAPLIILHPALTGSARAYSTGKPGQGDGWWKHCIGPDKFLDTRKFRIICVAPLGGNGGSSSAEEVKDFASELTFADGIRLLVMVLKKYGAESIYAVVGGSIGGGQALEWLFQDEIPIKYIVDISGSYCRNGKVSEFFKIQSDIIWGKGRNIPELTLRLADNIIDVAGMTPGFDLAYEIVSQKLSALGRHASINDCLRVARQVGFLRFVSPGFFQQKLEQYFAESNSEEHVRQRLESWFEHQGDIFVKRFSAQALALLCAMDARSNSKSAEEVSTRILKTGTSLIGFSVDGDVLFRSELQKNFYQQVAEGLPEEVRGKVSLDIVQDRIHGHDHFLTEKFLQSTARLSGKLYG